MELTETEKAFIINLLKQLTIAPSSSDAAQVVQVVQELLIKLTK